MYIKVFLNIMLWDICSECYNFYREFSKYYYKFCFS